MKVEQLKMNHWYEFTNYEGRISHCKYIGNDPTSPQYLYGWRYAFHFLDGTRYDYRARTIRSSFKPLFKSIADYFDLFETNKEPE